MGSFAEKRYKLNAGAGFRSSPRGLFLNQIIRTTDVVTWQSSPDETQRTVYHAIKVEHRHIDTATSARTSSAIDDVQS